MKLSPEEVAELVASLPWKMDARGYAIIKRSHLVTYLASGRTLNQGELVHHKNENKSDDRAENLEVMTKGEHARLHHPQKLGRYPGVEYTPELREKRRAQMLGNQIARKDQLQ